MRTAIVAALFAIGAPTFAMEDRLLTDFDKTTMQWYSVNDGVMGDRSSGSLQVTDGKLRFSGVLNTNGGGFASIRTRSRDLKLGGTKGLYLRVKGDGRTYSARVQDSDSRRSPSYRAEFKTRATGTWQEIWIPFSTFRASWRGRNLNRPPIDPAKIRMIGITLADNTDGAFSLDVDAIRAYAPFTLERNKWKSRTLVLFAPNAEDKRLAQQIKAIRASTNAFDERDMSLVVVLENGRSYADARTLDKSEVAAIRAKHTVKAGAFALKLIGKDGGVKRTESAPVEAAKLYEQIDGMPMRQAEMRN